MKSNGLRASFVALLLIPSLLLLLAPAFRGASQDSSVWITAEEQTQLVRSISVLLPPGWAIVRQELNRTPVGWSTTDTRSFAIEGRNGNETFNVWIVPADWIGIRQVRPQRGRWGAEVFRTPKFKAIVDADYQVYRSLEPLQKASASLVNGGQLDQTYRDRMDEVDAKTQTLINRYCNDRPCRDEAAYSLIVLGVPAQRIFLDCAEHGSGEPQERCASFLGYMSDSESRQVLERVVASPASSATVQKSSAYSLSQIANPSSGPALLQALGHAPAGDTLLAIVSALEDIHYEPAAPEMLRQMERDPRDVNRAWIFAHALASLRYAPAMEAIRKLCRTTQFSAEWILKEAKARNSLVLYDPEFSLLRLTGAWGKPSDGIRILLVAPGVIPETGRIEVAVLMENGSNRALQVIPAFYFGTVIVDDKVYPHALSVFDGSATLAVNAVITRAVELPEEVLDGRVHKLEFRAAGAQSNTLSLRLPKP